MLQREQLRHPHRPWHAHPGEIVPEQVDDHQILGTILFALDEGASEVRIVFRPNAPGAGSLDRPRLDRAIDTDLEESFGGCAHHRESRRLEVRGERRGLIARSVR